MTPEPPWRPSRREQHLLWWLRVLLIPIGTAGVIYEAVVRQDSIGMLIFGAMAVGTDVARLASGLVRAARDEARDQQQRSEEEARRP